ncbi:oligopeptidase A [Candidatus Curculioniphilus buchneri]|uniref:oligopeptidase A n=1 Tax=Candidatus Curculioniphilus buchneri TaxID=690594 RepID=UPI00376EB805
MTNPLLTMYSLPPFSSIRPEHVLPAIQDTLKHCYNKIEHIVEQLGPVTWDNLCQPLAEVNDHLSRIWAPIEHLNAVQNSLELRKVYEQSLLILSEYSTWVGQHKGLYQAYQNLHSGQHYMQLSVAQKKAVDNTLRDFELSGITLPVEKQQRYGKIVAQLSKLSSTYNNNILDATKGWNKLITDEQLLIGMPENNKNLARIRAKTYNMEGWLLTLDIPSYLAVLTYCDNITLRKELYYAYNTRASDQGPHAGQWDNGPIINEMLILRYELAQLLGFDSYADKSLVKKMANSPDQVISFLMDLLKRAYPKGKNEIEQLHAFAKQHFHCKVLEPWDLVYYSEKQKQHLFCINDETVKLFFPENQVISGLFKIINCIYGITAKERAVEVWHPDVRFFDLFDESGELRGSFYLDLYARDNKRSGAWMDSCIGTMRKADGTLQTAVAYLTCNCNHPIDGKATLLTHNEVIILFHEFGHGLHHILTRIDTPGVSGMDGIPWDAVELPSQFMENYCWQSDALTFISGHYQTKEPLPKQILSNLLKSRNFQAALFILRQIELSLFDLYIYYQYRPTQGPRVLETLIKVKKQVSVLSNMEWERLPHTFSHIFSGGYEAGYYSYLWADLLAEDAWSRFEEEGIFNRATGESFLNNILSRGGSEDPMELFIRFRGRKPHIKAMLRHYGIQENENHTRSISLI